MESPDTFGQTIKRYRKELDLTQEQLAGRVSCAPATIRKIEAGQRRPSRQMAEVLARALQIAPGNMAQFLAMARGIAPEAQPPASGFSAVFDAQVPLPASLMVNRSVELAAICSLLRRPDVQLLTLTGPGGVGKTRLAIQLAETMRDEFADGVRMLRLASLLQPDLLLTTVAHGLGFSPPDERSAQQSLLTYFEGKQMLLVLDNFEQILEAAPQVARWLESLSGLKVLVTSRARLRLAAEYEYPVPPMQLPDLDQLPSAEMLARCPAVELFVRRVQAIQPGFDLSEQNARAVAEICILLDGLPLAIELAAARCKLLDPASLLERLRHFHPLDLLTGGARDLPARQQTIRQTINWSYSLLAPVESLLFDSLGVFMGGATLEAIESLSNRSDDPALLDALQTLIDHSLVWRVELPNEPPRFQMLAMLREYALERLGERAALETFQLLHAEYFDAFVERTIPELHDSRQPMATRRLEAEQGNLRAALEWCCSTGGDAQTGMRLAGRLWEYWMIHGDGAEGETWMLRLLSRPGVDQPTVWRARLLNGLGMLVDLRLQDARQYFDESLAIFRSLDDRYGQAWVLSHLGQNAIWIGLYEQSRSNLEESLAMFHALGQDREIAWTLTTLTRLALLTDNPALAETTNSQALLLFQGIGDPRGVAHCHIIFGNLAGRCGNPSEAIRHYNEALQLFLQSGDIYGLASVNRRIGAALMQSGDLVEAARFLSESLRICIRIGEFGLCGFYCLIGLAELALKREASKQAAAMLGAAAALLEQVGTTYIREDESAEYSPTEQHVRDSLDEEEFMRLWREGRKAPTALVKMINETGAIDGFG